MKTAILGGRFDPVHVGHLLIARQVLEFDPSIDKVVFVPAYEHQWKPIVASSKDRTQMIKSMLEDKMEVSDIEIKRKGVSYSIDTIKAFKKETEAQIYWVVGSDIVREFNRWKNSEELIKEATFLVFPRDPYKLPENLPKGFELIKSSSLQIANFSSTVIRQRIKEGKTIKYLVAEKVEKYIKENNLYV
jgi:nicotinate-nucleotide adenylyltransferase